MNKNNNRDNFHLFIDKYIDWYIYNHIYIYGVQITILL